MHGEFFFGLLAFAGAIWLVGHDLLAAYFEQKAELLEKFLQEEDV